MPSFGSSGPFALPTSPGSSVGGQCPQGSTQVSPVPGGPGKAAQCPPGATRARDGFNCCQPAAPISGSLPSIPMPGAGGKGGGAPTPGKVPRPDLAKIDPQAEYDPEVARALAERRGYTQDLEKGTGFAMDVLQTSQNDQLESQITQARAAAEAAGIPFDEPGYRAQAQRDIYGSLAQEKLGREQLVGQSLGAGEGVATAQAGERNQRLGISLSAQQEQNRELLQRYGIDVSRYGVDVNAATAANNALLGFYSQLMGGMFGMLGNLGGMNYSSQVYYQ